MLFRSGSRYRDAPGVKTPAEFFRQARGSHSAGADGPARIVFGRTEAVGAMGQTRQPGLGDRFVRASGEGGPWLRSRVQRTRRGVLGKIPARSRFPLDRRGGENVQADRKSTC